MSPTTTNLSTYHNFDEANLQFSDAHHLSMQRLHARCQSAGGWIIGERFNDRFDTEVGGFSHIAQQWIDANGKLCGDWMRTASGQVSTERRPSVIVDYENEGKQYTEAEADGLSEFACVLMRLRAREEAYVAFLSQKEALKARWEARKRLYAEELKRKQVKFLPAQVMRPIFAKISA